MPAMEWRPYSAYGSVYVEITRAENKQSGELGTCLWSPTRNRAGADRYSIMRRPDVGDLVLHFFAQLWSDGRHESRLAGRSLVAARVPEVDEEPPVPGGWAGMSPYYRIELAGYEAFPRPLPLKTLVDDYGDEIRGDIISAAPRFYPFNPWGDEIRTVQGIYLAEATPGLYAIMRRAFGLEEVEPLSVNAGDAHLDYAEARRLARER